MTLAKRIRDCRYAKGWGPDELAQKADVSRTALYQIECGKTETPRAGTLRRIARALDVPVEKLLGQAHRDLDIPRNGSDFVSDSGPLDLPEYGRGDVPPTASADRLGAQPHFNGRTQTVSSDAEVLRKLKILLASPLGDAMCRIVEESYRMLPVLDES